MQGPPGENGINGLQGPRGFNGTNGINGTQGPQGPPGNISDICPIDTSLQLRFVSEVLSDAYIVTCTLDNPFVYVTWQDFTRGNDDEIFFRASSDNGTTFGPTINLSNITGLSRNPQIAAVGDNVYVTWDDNTLGNFEIFFRASDDNGQTFGPTINLSNNPTDSFLPQIAAVGDNVYVTWGDTDTGSLLGSDIFFAESEDNGQTFTTSINLSNSGSSSMPQIAAIGDNIYVTWLRSISGSFDIFFAESDDNGQTFTTPINISNSTGDTPFTELPNIAAVGDNVYVPWQDNTPGNDEIFFRASDDNGQTFSPTVNVSNNAGPSLLPQIVAIETINGNFVYVTWEDSTLGNFETFFRTSDDNGQTFGPTINVSNNTGFSQWPQIAAVGDNVYVTWDDNTLGNFEIFFRTSDDNGQTFGPTINVSNNTGFSQSPKIVAIINHIYVTWEELLGNGEIFFRASSDNGHTFGPTINVSNNTGFSQSPQIAVPSSG